MTDPRLLPYTGPQHRPFFWQGQRGCALLVHGFPGTPAEMRRLGGLIHDAGWSVRGMLLPGFGAEFPTIHTQTQEDWLRAVLAQVQELRAGCDRLVLVGNSMGAALALQAAARSQVDGLVLFAPWWRINSRALDALAPATMRVVREIRPFRQANFGDPRLIEVVQHVLPDADINDPEVQLLLRSLVFPTRVLAEVRRAGQCGYAAAPHAHAPTLVIQGSNDPLAHPNLTARLVARLPHLVGHAVVDAGHELAHLKNEREMAVGPLLVAFLDLVARGRLDQPAEPDSLAPPRMPAPSANGHP